MQHLDERRMALKRTQRLVANAARELGHDPHPWRVDAGTPWHLTTACRSCGFDLGAGVDADGHEYGQGAATIRPCHIAASDTAESPRPTKEVAA